MQLAEDSVRSLELGILITAQLFHMTLLLEEIHPTILQPTSMYLNL